MLKPFTRDELLNEWLIRRGYLPLRADGTADLSTGSDIRAWASRRVADWVAEVFATAPIEMLPWTDCAAEATLSDAGCGSATIKLPAEISRVIAVRLAGWRRSAEPVDAGNPRAEASGNPFLCGDSCDPLAIRQSDGTLRVMPAGEGSKVEALICVDKIPADGADLLLDPRLLGTLEPDKDI